MFSTCTELVRGDLYRARHKKTNKAEKEEKQMQTKTKSINIMDRTKNELLLGG